MATVTEALRYAVGKLQVGEFEEVERIGREVLRHDAQNADALHLLGLAARKQQQFAAAIDYFRQAVSQRGDKALYHFELAVSLRLEGDIEGALACYQRALALDPGMYAAYVNLGAALDDLGRHTEALPLYQRALEIKPDCPNTHANLGNSLQALGRLEDSIAAYRRALALDPKIPATHWNYAMALLRAGHFREGWEEYEWRSDANETKLDAYRQPAWDGSSLAGKTLLVHAEQGVGDEILFASCYPDLMRQAEQCIFICEPRLRELMARSFPAATVIGYRRKHERTPCDVAQHVDYQIPAGSVPRFLRTEAGSFPSHAGYLCADPVRVRLWQQRLAAIGPGYKVGISWRAGGKPSEQVRRTTELELWRPLLELPGVQFINLQYGQTAEDLSVLRGWGYTIHDWEDADPLTDLDGLAAMITALDLVISVGNTTVHLAGSLGEEVWSLVAANPSWRWMDSGDRVPWYDSVRLFRQQRGMTWQPVFERLYKELCQRIGRDPVPFSDFMRSTRTDPTQCPSETLRIPAHVSGMKFVARLTETVETAVRHHQAGELAQAEVLYRDVLKNTPQHADALHLLGVVCQQTGRTPEALRLIRQAIVLNDTIPSFHYHLALAQKDAGMPAEAIQSFRRAIELKPDYADAYSAAAVAMHEQGLLLDAIDLYHLALTHAAASPSLLVNLATALRSMGRHDDARRHLEHALQLQRVFPEARVQLGLVAQEQHRLSEAIEHFQQALADHPDHAAAYRQLGKVQMARQGWDEAIVLFQRGLELNARDFESAANLGVAFEQQEQFALAADAYAAALALQPHTPTQLRRVDALRHLGRLPEALADCDQLLAREPHHIAAHCARGQILLQQCQFERGWPDYEWRCRSQQQEFGAAGADATWDGSPLSGRSITVQADAALNETLMWAACLSDVISQADRTFVSCDPQLASLIARTFPEADVRPTSAGLPSCDVQVCLAQLPRLLGYDAEKFQRRKSLVVEARRRAAWQAQLRCDLPLIGLLWRGRHKLNVVPGTSRAPAMEHWRRFLAMPGMQFVGLLPDVRPDELEALCGMHPAPMTLPPAEDMETLAAQLQTLDLVITIDDLTAHLAGSLGKEVWLIASHAWGWQWPLDRERAPWYARVKVFRPRRLTSWPELMDRVQAALAQWLETTIHPPHAQSHRPLGRFLKSGPRQGVRSNIASSP